VSLARGTPLRRKSQSPLAIANDNFWAAFSWMIREEGDRTYFTCGTKIDPKQKDERNISMAFYTCGRNVSGVTSSSRKFGIRLGILQTLERRAKLYFDYTIPMLEKMAAVAKLGAKGYFIHYESIRPGEK
jgi:hypothetical protein